MSAPNPTKPFGMNDIKLTNISGTTQVDLPASRKMMIKPRFKTGEFHGDDSLQGVASFLEAYEWEIEAGGLSLEALAIITGVDLTTTGVSPNEIKTTTLAGATRMPYFKAYGKSLGEGDDDVHVLLFKCKLNEGPEGTLENGAFLASNIKGIAIDDGVNGIIDIVVNETAATLPSS